MYFENNYSHSISKTIIIYIFDEMTKKDKEVCQLDI